MANESKDVFGRSEAIRTAARRGGACGRRLHVRAFAACAAAFMCFGFGERLFAQSATPSEPAWWTATATAIINTASASNNYAPVNIGQLKHVASMAYAYLNAEIPSAINFALTDVVPAPPPQGEANTATRSAYEAWLAANHAPANLGQLKAVAVVFYHCLNASKFDTVSFLQNHGYGATWPYAMPFAPPPPAGDDGSVVCATYNAWLAANYAPANIGQLKNVFAFTLENFVPEILCDAAHPWVDANFNGIRDDWELAVFGNLTTATAISSAVGAGMSDRELFRKSAFAIPAGGSLPEDIEDSNIGIFMFTKIR